jgi:hypothetical protein
MFAAMQYVISDLPGFGPIIHVPAADEFESLSNTCIVAQRQSQRITAFGRPCSSRDQFMRIGE